MKLTVRLSPQKLQNSDSVQKDLKKIVTKTKLKEEAEHIIRSSDKPDVTNSKVGVEVDHSAQETN